MNAAATTGNPSPARTWNGSCPGTPTPETSAPGHSRPRPDNRTGTATITASPRTRSRRPLAYPITGLPNTYAHPARRPAQWVLVRVTEAYIHCSKHIPKLIPQTRVRHWGTDNPRHKGGDYFGAAARKLAEPEADPVPAGTAAASLNEAG